MVCRRATSPTEAADLFLSRIDLPTRRFALLSVPTAPTRPRPTLDFVGAETDGVLLPIKPPMREVLPDDVPTLEVLPELATGCLAPVGVEGLPCFRRGKPVPVETGMPIELPMRPCDLRSELVPVEREILLELERLLERATGCFAAVETDGLSILIELPMRDLEPEADRSILIDRLPDEDADGILILMELPIRALLPGLIRMLELLPTEVEPVELLLIDELDEGLRKLEELEGLETVIRLDVEPPGLLRVCIVPERLGVDRLGDILIELLRLGTDRIGLRLADIVLDRLSVGARLTDDLLELLRLGTDRLEIIVLDRLGVGALLRDDLLELLRLGVDRLGLRLADIELDRLGAGARLRVGARLTDDLLGLLRLGVLALAGGAGLAACVLWLELRELELFLEVLAARAGSAARASSKMKQVNRKSKLGNRNLFL